LGSNIVIQYSIVPIINLNGRITAREYVDRLSNQVHPMIQTLFPNNNAIFQEDNTRFRIVGTIQLWFEEHEGEHQHLLWPTQSPVFNTTEPLWSLLKTTVRNRFPLQHL
jgi:hypothetical protein